MICYTPGMTTPLKALRKKTDKLKKRGKATPGRLLAQAWMELDAAHIGLGETPNEAAIKRAAKVEAAFDRDVHLLAQQRTLDGALLDCSKAVKAGLDEDGAMQLMRDTQAACCHAEKLVNGQRMTAYLFGLAVHGEHNEVASLHDAGIERLPALAGILSPDAPISILGAWPFAEVSQWLLDPQALYDASSGCLSALLSGDEAAAKHSAAQALGSPLAPNAERAGQIGGYVLLGCYLHFSDASSPRGVSAFEEVQLDAWEEASTIWQAARGEATLLMGAPRPIWESAAESVAWSMFQGMNIGRLMDDLAAVQSGVRLHGICLAVDPLAIPGAQSEYATRTIGVFTDGSQLEKPIFRDQFGFLLPDIAMFLDQGMGIALEIATHANLAAALKDLAQQATGERA